MSTDIAGSRTQCGRSPLDDRLAAVSRLSPPSWPDLAALDPATADTDEFDLGELLDARLRASPAEAWRDQHVIQQRQVTTGAESVQRPPAIYTAHPEPHDRRSAPGPSIWDEPWQGARPDTDALARLALHLTLAALPLLAISAHVFGLVAMHLTAGLVVVPLILVIVALALFDPRPEERVIAHGMLWGVVATVVYDAVRLDTAYLLGLWGDFIPTVGTWIMGVSPEHRAGGAVVGYLWRYLGDGGGIGVTFFVLAAATGLWRRSTPVIVASAVGFAVFPVWAGLIATVALAPQGQTLMFPLTKTTIILSLIGHLVFGLVLGLGAARSRSRDLSVLWPATLTINPAALPDLPLAGLFGRSRAGRWDAGPPPQPAERPARSPVMRQLPPRRPEATLGPQPEMAALSAGVLGRTGSGCRDPRRQGPPTGQTLTSGPASPSGGFPAVPGAHVTTAWPGVRREATAPPAQENRI